MSSTDQINIAKRLGFSLQFVLYKCSICKIFHFLLLALCVWIVLSEHNALTHTNQWKHHQTWQNILHFMPIPCQRFSENSILPPVSSRHLQIWLLAKCAVITYPGNSCWFQTGMCSPASPQRGQLQFLCCGHATLWPRAGLPHHPIAASSHCHADLGRPHAIHRCQGDRWAEWGCSPHHRGCRKHRESPGRSAGRKEDVNMGVNMFKGWIWNCKDYFCEPIALLVFKSIWQYNSQHTVIN